MKFLVLSHTHSLLPFAYRLQSEGHEVQPVVTVAAFEAAWHGKMDPSPRDPKNRLEPEFLDSLVAGIDTSNSVVLTDDWKLQEKFKEAGAKRIFGVHTQQHTTLTGMVHPIRVGGWFDGENLHGHHLLVVDRGAWPGGMGPATDGAVTIIRIDPPETVWMVDQLADQKLVELRSSGFQGLVQFDLNFRTETGEPQVSGMIAGWPFLHTHAFLSELEDFGGLLAGELVDELSTSHHLLAKKFVLAIPISRPPWPTRKARFRFDLVPIAGLTPEQMGRVFWHDVQVDPEAGQLKTAGLDGLIGVARGSADTSELARVRALEVALRLQLPEKQFRSDAGMQVQSVLAEFEGRFGVLL